MGGTTFRTEAEGPNIGEAYSAAVEDAYWESGHGGYTGTIAEKSGYVEGPAIDRSQIDDIYERLMNSEVDAVVNILGCGASKALELIATFDDKWGPAVGFRLKGDDDRYVFMGWAST